MKNLRAAIGKLSVLGYADIAPGGLKPVIKAAIEAGGLVIDPLSAGRSKDTSTRV